MHFGMYLNILHHTKHSLQRILSCCFMSTINIENDMKLLGHITS